MGGNKVTCVATHRLLYVSEKGVCFKNGVSVCSLVTFFYSMSQVVFPVSKYLLHHLLMATWTLLGLFYLTTSVLLSVKQYYHEYLCPQFLYVFLIISLG